jgi:hypothetical protein
MVDPATLISALVTKLRLIPGVVTEMDGDATAVAAYEDTFPSATSLQNAIATMPSPGILVVWNGSGPAASGRGERWTHRFSLILRARNKYTTLYSAIMNGVPTGGTLKFPLVTLDAGCSPINTATCDRRSLFIDERTSLDFFELQFSLAERGISA